MSFVWGPLDLNLELATEEPWNPRLSIQDDDNNCCAMLPNKKMAPFIAAAVVQQTQKKKKEKNKPNQIKCEYAICHKSS